MRTFVNPPAVIVWVALVGATLTTWSLSAKGSLVGHPLTVASILIITFVKVWLIGAYFMELRGAPNNLRLLFGGWCAIVCASLVGLAVVG